MGASVNLRHSIVATFLAYAAEWAFVIVLFVYAFQADGVVGVGIAGMARTIPAAVVAPVLSGVTDRLGRQRLLVSVHATRAAAIGLAAVVVAGELPIVVYALATVEGLAAVLHRPTLASLLPGLARDPNELVSSNASVSVAENVGTFAGPAAGSLLAASGALPLAMAVPAAAFATAAILMTRVRPAATRRPASRLTPTEMALGGIAAIWSRSTLRLLIGLAGAQTLVRGILTVLLVAASVELLRLGEEGVGYLTSAVGAGGMLGALLAAAVVAGRGLAGPVAAGLVLWGVPIVVIGLVGDAAAAFVLMAVIGIGNAIFDVGLFTLLQRTTPNADRARIFGVLEALIMLTVGLGSVIAPVLVSAVGVRGALVVIGVVLPVLGMLSRRALRSAEREVVLPEREIALLRGVPIFAPLPLTVLEQLAADLAEEWVEAGATIIRQGETGDRFYILVEGLAEVAVDARPVGQLRDGDGFGEIALLRDVPRSATVTAARRSLVATLSRDAFIAAVTGDRASQSAADAVVARRMAAAAPHHPDA